MADLDRDEIIGLLERLGATDDQEVLAAARSVHARLAQAGATWDDLLRLHLSASVEADPPEEAPVAMPAAVGEKGDDAKLLDQLLARKGLSKELRQSLAELKRSLGDGSIDAEDRRYIRALAKRLGV